METWKQITNFEDYEVSTNGRIKKGENIMSTHVCAAGPLAVVLTKDGKKYFRHVGKLVLDAFNPGKGYTKYLDGDQSNAKLYNLDRRTTSPNAKLTKAQAKHIKESNLPYDQIQDLYGICKSTIQKIKQGSIWKNS